MATVNLDRLLVSLVSLDKMFRYLIKDASIFLFERKSSICFLKLSEDN